MQTNTESRNGAANGATNGAAAMAFLKEPHGDGHVEELRVVMDSRAGNPLAQSFGTSATKAAVTTDYYGAFSVEKFAAASSLTYTHDDAKGWLDYVQQFQAANFWYQDAGVAPWAYYEQYDNWQDTYGMDAVMAVYHSGHGSMGSDGTFYAAMGADWGGLGTNAASTSMKLGNEQVRYIFWSTCYSLRVLGAHNPIRSWNASNLGFRMLFGYETTSIDAPNYGRDFWKQWNKGKSLSQAHLDMSWYDVSTHQAPSVCACGATAAEASDRLYNERFFNWGAVSRDYWHWRWYYAAGTALAARARNHKLPQRVVTARLGIEPVNGKLVRGLLDRIPLDVSMKADVDANPAGIIVLGEGDTRIAIERNSTYDAQLRAPNLNSTNELQLTATILKAQDVVRQFGLDRNDITFDRVLYKYDCCGTTKGSGDISTPRIVETVVQFTQLIEGIPVIGPGEGKVSITLDNDENVTAVLDTTRRIDKLVDAYSAPLMNNGAAMRSNGNAPPEPVRTEQIDPEAMLSAAWQEKMKTWVLSNNTLPKRYAVVPDSYEIGYVIRGNNAILMAREEIEADCGGGFTKRFVVETPLHA
jgi:hypothetical protein